MRLEVDLGALIGPRIPGTVTEMAAGGGFVAAFAVAASGDFGG
jgi:hypothetical protein